MYKGGFFDFLGMCMNIRSALKKKGPNFLNSAPTGRAASALLVRW
jgi:hypothetical protein